jgi:hypothetical protein
MRREEFEDHLAAFSRTKTWALGERELPVSRQELHEYERTNGFTFPIEYAHIAQSYGAGQFGFVDLFSVRFGEWQIDVHRATAPSLPAAFVPISDNGCGDFYGFVVAEGRCDSRILFADHETGYSLASTDMADVYEYIQRHGFHAA